MDSQLPRLTPRLALAASFVRKGSKIADIGTDHAYLPVWLVNSENCPCAVASDVREGPLERAKITARYYGAQDKISFTLADGLRAIRPEQADDVVIAGMGGELIAEIILQCLWLKNPEKHLVLQPMTAQAELHDFLYENGFMIENEAVASEKQDEKLYLVISAHYSGERKKTDSVSRICGTLPRDGGKTEQLYLQKQAKTLLKRAAGIRTSKNADTTEAEKAEEIAHNILDLCSKMQR